MRRAVFPGSFDPVTLGHKDMVLRAAGLFDEIIVAVGVNPDKKPMFSKEERCQMLEEVFSAYDNIKIDSFEGLLVDFADKNDAVAIVRGLRNPLDFEYELPMAQINKDISRHMETIFLVTSPEYSIISSQNVRELISYGMNAEKYIPAEVSKYIKNIAGGTYAGK